ncbi:MAG: PDZ domain-containing protein [Gammaproteobacteria bacterium]|nr:PDZ domain-containing protein [Gammaproteobacteria bacterium]
MNSRLPSTLSAMALAASLIAGPALAAGQPATAYLHRVAHAAAHQGPATSAERPRLGIAISAISQADLDAASLEYGVRVDGVQPESVAAAAGLKAGDIVTAVGDRPAYSPERLQHLVRQAGDSTTVAVVRNGDEMTLRTQFAKPKSGSGQALLGIRIQPMTDDLREAFGAVAGNGVLISQVTDGSAAADGGLKAGDIVVSIDGVGVATTRDIQRLVRSRTPGDRVSITILRDRAEQQLDVALGEAPKVAMAKPGGHPHGMHGHGKHHHGKHHGKAHPYGKHHGHGSYGGKHGCDMKEKKYRAS